MDFGFLANVADAIPQVTGQFNRKYQDSQVAIAQANAQAAEANAKAAPAGNNTWIWVVLAIVILAGILLMMHR